MHLVWDQRVAGSNPVIPTIVCGVIAQLGEHLPCTQGVRGSIPLGSTNIVFFYGGIAQLARASGSYPAGRRFKSHRRYHSARWSRGQDTALSRRNHGFDSRTGHHTLLLTFGFIQPFVSIYFFLVSVLVFIWSLFRKFGLYSGLYAGS